MTIKLFHQAIIIFHISLIPSIFPKNRKPISFSFPYFLVLVGQYCIDLKFHEQYSLPAAEPMVFHPYATTSLKILKEISI
jgi:hypothetical protein